jgi:hypothetical protein
VNADAVAAAIVAASRETGADPLRVASGQRDLVREPMAHETSRARAYAALALREWFPTHQAMSIARVVGSQSPQVYLSVLQRRKRTFKWWDEAAFWRVLGAVEQAERSHGGSEPAEAESLPTPAPGPPDSPPAPIPPRPLTPGKRNLLEDLRRAVENTARMTLREP